MVRGKSGRGCKAPKGARCAASPRPKKKQKRVKTAPIPIEGGLGSAFGH